MCGFLLECECAREFEVSSCTVLVMGWAVTTTGLIGDKFRIVLRPTYESSCSGP